MAKRTPKGRPGSRLPALVDPQFARALSHILRQHIMERACGEVEGEQGEAAKRMAKANGDGDKVTGYSVALLAFETAWDPSSLQSRKKK
jgi:hypothetical protein